MKLNKVTARIKRVGFAILLPLTGGSVGSVGGGVGCLEMNQLAKHVWNVSSSSKSIVLTLKR